MVRSGRPVAEVARLFGVGRATIRRRLVGEEIR
jgi:transposase-like protein